MADDRERYVFRIYNIIDNDKLKRDIAETARHIDNPAVSDEQKQWLKVKKQRLEDELAEYAGEYFWGSPYKYGQGGETYAREHPGEWKNMGEVQHAPDDYTLDEDYLMRSNDDKMSSEEYAEKHGGDFKLDSWGGTEREKCYHGHMWLPHKGLSVIGLSDPMYSIYPLHDIDDRKMFSHTDNGMKLDREYLRALHPAVQDMYNFAFTKYMGKSPDELFDDEGYFKGNAEDAEKFAANKDTIAEYPKLVPSVNAFPSMKAYRLYSQTGYPIADDKYKWMKLLNSIANTAAWSSGNSLVLAGVPEKAIYTPRELDRQGIAAAMDFPEEMLVKYLRPVKKWSLKDRLPVDKGGGLTEWSKLLDRIKELLNAPKGWDMENRPEYWENEARKFIRDNFDIDPVDIVSDELKKEIFMDLSSCYNGTKPSEHILEGLTQGGRRWQ